MRALALYLTAMLLMAPGCLEAVQEPVDTSGRRIVARPDGLPPQLGVTPWTFGTPSSVADPARGGQEPAIAADLQGRLFVGSNSFEKLAVSLDDGQTWTIKNQPPPPGPRKTGGGFDDVVDVAPWGALFYHRPFSESGGGVAGAGVQVASSYDAGDTWATNTFIHHVNGSASPTVISDRQWLAFEGNNTVYLVYNCMLSQVICSLRSDDRGKTFTPTPSIVATEAQKGAAPAGQPFVDPKGVLVVPYWGQVAGPDGGARSRAVMVGISKDRGQTFTQSVVYYYPFAADVAGGWPEITYLRNGTWLASWSRAGGINFAFSENQGASWTKPLIFAADEAAAGGAAPWVWMGVHNAKHPWIDAVFTSKGHVRALRLFENGQYAFADVGAPGGGNTDYPHGTWMPDGRLAAVYVPSGGGLAVAVTNW